MNSVLIFELDPRNCHSAWTVLWLSSVFCFFWTLTFFSFIILDITKHTFYVLPILFPVLLILWLFTPLSLGPWSSTRSWIRKVFIAQIKVKRNFEKLFLIWIHFKAGFVPVTFVDFWFADQLNSLVSVFLDFEFTVCFLLRIKILFQMTIFSRFLLFLNFELRKIRSWRLRSRFLKLGMTKTTGTAVHTGTVSG